MRLTCEYAPNARTLRHGATQGDMRTLLLLPMHTVRFLSPRSRNARFGLCKLKLNSKRLRRLIRLPSCTSPCRILPWGAAGHRW